MTEGAPFARKYEPPANGNNNQERKPSKGAKTERTSKTKRALEPTDDQIAEAFAEEHRNDLRFVAAWGKGFEWRGGCWREEKTLSGTFDLIRKTSRAQGIERAGMAKMVGAVPDPRPRRSAAPQRPSSSGTPTQCYSTPRMV